MEEKDHARELINSLQGLCDTIEGMIDLQRRSKYLGVTPFEAAFFKKIDDGILLHLNKASETQREAFLTGDHPFKYYTEYNQLIKDVMGGRLEFVRIK